MPDATYQVCAFLLSCCTSVGSGVSSKKPSKFPACPLSSPPITPSRGGEWNFFESVLDHSCSKKKNDSKNENCRTFFLHFCVLKAIFCRSFCVSRGDLYTAAAYGLLLCDISTEPCTRQLYPGCYLERGKHDKDRGLMLGKQNAPDSPRVLKAHAFGDARN